MTRHDIRVQAWGHDPVLVCRTCSTQVEGNTVPTVLARTQDHAGLSFALITEAIEEHTGEGAFRAVRVDSERVEGQIEFGAADLGPEEEAPLVAYGPPDEFGPGYHPRTGQKLAVDADSPMVPVEFQDGAYSKPFLTPGNGGPSLKEYLESKGEL